MTGDDLRIGDAEREAVAELLREHCANGRLTLEEFNERLDAAYAARTNAELRRVTSDLPGPVPAAVGVPATRPWQRRGPAWPSPLRYLPVLLVVPALWLVSGLFWAAGWHGGPPMPGQVHAHWALWPIFAFGRLLVLLALVGLIWRRGGRRWAGRHR